MVSCVNKKHEAIPRLDRGIQKTPDRPVKPDDDKEPVLWMTGIAYLLIEPRFAWQNIPMATHRDFFWVTARLLLTRQKH